MIKLRYVIVLINILLMGTVSALTIPAQPDNYINDYAHLLSPATVQALNAQQAEFEQKTTNQIVVAIFPSLENESLEDFTTRLEDQWKIGQKGKDNGILMTIFVKEHQVRIEVGYGLESVVTDAQAGDIIQRDITPNFRAKNYDAGVSAALNDLMQLAAKADQPAPIKQVAAHSWSFTQSIVGGLFMLSLVVFVVAYKLWLNTQKSPPTLKQEYIPCDNPANSEQMQQEPPKRRGMPLTILLFILNIIFLILTGGRGGGGGRSGGGGFGGGGGGRSGGGGASGGW